MAGSACAASSHGCPSHPAASYDLLQVGIAEGDLRISGLRWTLPWSVRSAAGLISLSLVLFAVHCSLAPHGQPALRKPGLSRFVGLAAAAATAAEVAPLPDMQTEEVPYKKLTAGSCTDWGLQAISDADGCNEAGRTLKMTFPVPLLTGNDENRPEGCYIFQNDADHSTTIWLNTNPKNKGKGAETSDNTGGWRLPLCRQPSPETTARPQAPSDTASLPASLNAAMKPAKFAGDVSIPVAWAGCYMSRSAARRALVDIGFHAGTTQGCAFKCQEFKHILLQDGMCRCMDLLPSEIEYTKVGDSQCGDPCKGEGSLVPTRLCGTETAAAVYALGAPLADFGLAAKYAE